MFYIRRVQHRKRIDSKSKDSETRTIQLEPPKRMMCFFAMGVALHLYCIFAFKRLNAAQDTSDPTAQSYLTALRFWKIFSPNNPFVKRQKFLCRSVMHNPP